MHLCKDGRIWGQNNKEAGGHLGISITQPYIKKGHNPNSIGRPFKKGYKICNKELVLSMKTCSIENCNNKHYAKGLCEKHCSAENYQSNRGEILKRTKQYRQEHRDEINQWQRDHYHNNKKQLNEQHKKYYLNNKESCLEYGQQWREKNKEHTAKRAKQWRQTPNGKASLSASRSNRRALQKGLTKETVQRVYEDNIKKYGTLTCILCNNPIAFGEDSLDHLTPLSRVGTNDYENLGIAHLICNLRKGTMTLKEWFAKKGVEYSGL